MLVSVRVAMLLGFNLELTLVAEGQPQDRIGLLSEETSNQEAPIWTVGYYRTYFDVSTNKIASRLLKALIPLGPFYPEHDCKPDL